VAQDVPILFAGKGVASPVLKELDHRRGDLISLAAVRRLDYGTVAVLVVLLSAILAAACLVRLALYPSAGGDAWGYTTYALGFRNNGFLRELGSVRTYGYPAFLYLVSFLVPADGRVLWLGAGLIQYGIFVIASLWLAKLVWSRDRKLGCAILVGLLLNPFLISVVVDCLTDSLIAPVIVLLTALSLAVTTFSGFSSTVISAGAGTFLACFALMVRPAALPFVVAWNAVALLTIWWNRHFSAQASLLRSLSSVSARMRGTGLYAILLLAAAFVTWTPQIYYNYATWGKISMLPVCRFDLLQVASSIPVLRYDTVVNGGSAEPLMYENPFSSPTQIIHRHPINWYFEYWKPALETTLLRLLAGLSVNHLFTYVYPGPKLVELIWLLVYWTIICLGVLRLCCSLADAITDVRDRLQWRCNGAAAFVAASTIGVLGLNSFTWIELRFNLMPISVLSVFGVDAVLRKNRHFARPKLLLLALGAACALTVFSELMLSTLIVSGPLRAGPQHTLPPLNCYTFTWEAHEGHP
jgi:hypothetical protein